MITPIKTNIFIVALALALSGCASATYSTGKDFDMSKVHEIVKSKTTTVSVAPGTA